MTIGLLVLYSLISSFILVHQDQKINEQEIVTAEAAESIVSLEDMSGKGRGTGFVTLAKSGRRVIVTNAHVCEINNILPVFVVYRRHGDSLRKPLKSPAVVIKKDDKHDLCIVSVPLDLDARPLELADKAYVDTRIYIVGYPIVALLSASDGYIRGYHLIDDQYPLALELCKGKKYYTKTVPIEQENGMVVKETRCFFRAKFMFTDALGDHGQSGSPGLNGDGEVVGVMSMIDGDFRPFAFLVPLSNLKEFLSTY
jgi:S1-C subfamily serine protease